MGGWVSSLLASGTSFGYGDYDRIIPTPIGGVTKTGSYVDKEAAKKLSSWFGAYRILADQFAMVNLDLFKRTKEGGHEPVMNWLYRVLCRKPNSQQNIFTHRHQLFTDRFWDGNCFAYIQQSDAGILAGLVPLAPWRVQVKQRPNLDIYYLFTDQKGKEQTYERNEIFHWIGPSDDGITGKSLISYAADQIGISIKRQDHQENLLDNRAMPSGLVTVQGKLNQDTYKDLKEKIKSNFEGAKNSGKVMVLDNGSQFARIGLSNQDMQYIEDKRMDIGDVERFTGVPSLLLGDNSSSTFNNMVEANRRLLKYGLAPHLNSFEQAVWDQLIPDNKKDEWFAQFDRTDFEKMDLEKQSMWVQNMVYSCAMSPNEARAEFNLSPWSEAWADVPLRPVNMAPANAPYVPKGQNPADPTAADAAEEQPGNDPKPVVKQPKKPAKSSKTATKDAFSGVFQQIYGRMSTKTSGHYSRLVKNHGIESAAGRLREFLKEQVENYTAELKPSVMALAATAGDIPLSLENSLDGIVVKLVDEFGRLALEDAAAGEITHQGDFGSNAVDMIFTLLEVRDE